MCYIITCIIVVNKLYMFQKYLRHNINFFFNVLRVVHIDVSYNQISVPEFVIIYILIVSNSKKFRVTTVSLKQLRSMSMCYKNLKFTVQHISIVFLCKIFMCLAGF